VSRITERAGKRIASLAPSVRSHFGSSIAMPLVSSIVERHIDVLYEKDKRSKEPNTVFVKCLDVRDGSVSKVFHVALPVGAQVRLLRQRLKPHATKSAVLAQHVAQPSLTVVLEDSDFVPGEITLSKFDGTVSHGMVLTKQQCFNVQRLLRLTFEAPEVQRMLDDMQKKAAGADEKYRWRLSALLQTEVYPSISRHFGLDDKGGATLPVHALGWHSQTDIKMTQDWMQLEMLMRNRDAAAAAMAQLNFLQSPATTNPEPQLNEAPAHALLPVEPGDPTEALSGRVDTSPYIEKRGHAPYSESYY